MVGCLVAGLIGIQMESMGVFGIYMRTFLGVAVGASITPELLSKLPQIALSLAFVPLYVLVIGAIGFLIFRKAGYDRVTAFYSAVPGGLQDMLVFGDEAGGNVRAMSLIHATRVLVIFSAAPIVVTQLWDLDLTRPLGVPAGDLPLTELATMFVAGLAGWRVAAKIGIPGSSIIGPLILTAALSLSGLISNRPPAEIMWAAQFFIGLAVGVRYVGVTAKELRQDILAGLVFVVLSGIASIACIAAIIHLLHSDPVDTTLAFLPGGQAEMAIVAIVAGSDVAFVVAHHLLRILIVLLFAQAMAGWLLKK